MTIKSYVIGFLFAFLSTIIQSAGAGTIGFAEPTGSVEVVNGEGARMMLKDFNYTDASDTMMTL